MPCPFCLIASSIPPSPSPQIITSPLGSAYPILSTPTVVAFLDIAPIARGHILLCPRTHRAKISDLSPSESAALGFWLPTLSRAVMRALYGDEEGSWNVLQANGAEAGQTVPHAHFHIIPRGSADSGIGGQKSGEMSDAERKNLVLGEGPRVKLDAKDGEEVSGLVNAELHKEVERLKGAGEMVDYGEKAQLWLKVTERGLKL